MSRPVYCQSCGMPMAAAKDFGTEKDGSKSTEYCNYCYQKGKWTAPEITFDEMLKLGLKGIDGNDEMGRLMKWMVKKMYPSQLRNLKRWKK